MSLPEFESELVAELKRLDPVEPSDRLVAAIARDLDERAAMRPKVIRWGLVLVPLAAAAAVAVFLIPRAPQAQDGDDSEAASVASASIPPMNDFVPVSAVNRLYDARDMGLVTNPDGGRSRRVVYRYLDTVTWQNPVTRATFEFTVPRDEVLLVRADGF